MHERFNPRDFVRVNGRESEHFSFPDILVSLDLLSLKIAEPFLHTINLYERVKEQDEPHGEVQDGAEEQVHKLGCPEVASLYEVIEKCRNSEFSGKSDSLEPNGYLGYVPWHASHFLLRALGAVMPTIPMFASFLGVLESGIGYDINRNKIPAERLKASLDEILGYSQKTSDKKKCRREWLDAKFSWDRQGRIWMESDHRAEGELDLRSTRKIQLPYQINRATFNQDDDCNIVTLNRNAWIRAGLPFWLPEKGLGSKQKLVQLWTPLPTCVASFEFDPEGGIEELEIPAYPNLCCNDLDVQNYSDKGVRPVIIIDNK